VIAREVIGDFLSSHDLDFDRPNENSFFITLPGEKKLETHCALIIGDHSLTVSAFVIRKPDSNSAAVHEWMLKQNGGMYSVTYAINELGDIYLVGRFAVNGV